MDVSVTTLIWSFDRTHRVFSILYKCERVTIIPVILVFSVTQKIYRWPYIAFQIKFHLDGFYCRTPSQLNNHRLFLTIPAKLLSERLS